MAIADAGVSSSCSGPEVSECRKYIFGSDPFVATSHESKNIFQYAGGEQATADKIKQLPLKILEGAKYVQMVPGIQNNLLRTNQFDKAKYITIFDKR